MTTSETTRYDMTQHDILFMKKRKPDFSRFGLDWYWIGIGLVALLYVCLALT